MSSRPWIKGIFAFGFATLALLPAFYWGTATGMNGVLPAPDSPPGQSAYVLAKLSGLYAFLLLWLQAVYGLTRGRFLGWKIAPWRIASHRLLGIIALILISLHFGLYFTAVTMRKGALAWALFLPPPISDSYSLALAIGWFALLAVVLGASVGIFGLAATRFGRHVHRLGVLALFVGFVHAYLIGSETNLIPVLVLYGLLIGIAFIALVTRYRKRGNASTGNGI